MKHSRGFFFLGVRHLNCDETASRLKKEKKLQTQIRKGGRVCSPVMMFDFKRCYIGDYYTALFLGAF